MLAKLHIFPRGVPIPELLMSIRDNLIIKSIIGSRTLKRRSPCLKNEQYDTHRENIDRNSAIVNMLHHNFRCHVAWSAQLGFQPTGTIFPSQICSEPKVCDFQIEIFVKQ